MGMQPSGEQHTGIAQPTAWDALTHLTPREHQVLVLLADGKTSRVIAADLYLSPETVREYIARIYKKLGVNSRAQCALEAMRRKLI